MPITEFTPFTAAIGGILIGLSLILYLVTTGGGAGISCMFSSVFSNGSRITWHLPFALGLVSGGWLIGKLYPISMDIVLPIPPYLLLIAGVLVGFGSQLSGGCTSGHGVIGFSRLMKRSIIATVTFFLTAVITASIVHGLWGVSAI